MIEQPQLPNLTIREWWVILDATSSTALMPDQQPGDFLPHSIRDAISLEHLDRKYQIHTDVLMTKLGNLSENDWSKVWAVVQGFWEQDGWEQPAV